MENVLEALFATIFAIQALAFTALLISADNARKSKKQLNKGKIKRRHNGKRT